MQKTSKAQQIFNKISPELSSIDKKVDEMGHYFVFYTHTYEQKNESGKNLLSIPRSPRFDEAEFYGLLLDMTRDYAMNMRIELKDDPLFGAFVNTMKKLYKKGEI